MTKAMGTLYLVATPIGNLQDMTFRAIEVLKAVDCIAAEDTRHSRTLLESYQITTPVISLHQYNEKKRSEAIVEKLCEGKSMALISDAGTPVISDPGESLVKAVREVGCEVVPIPGACAAIAALSVSGIDASTFCFQGFLPAKASSRKKALQALCYEERTLVFYEAPHRVLETVKDMYECFGADRKLVVARELTKRFETIQVGCLGAFCGSPACAGDDEGSAGDDKGGAKNDEKTSVIPRVGGESILKTSVIPGPVSEYGVNSGRESISITPKGEFVLILEGSKQAPEDQNLEDAKVLLAKLTPHMPLKTACGIVEEVTGVRKNVLYKIGVQAT